MNAFPLYAKKVVATGKLKNYTRADLIAILTELGAIPNYQVSKKTDYLIVGSRPGKKLNRATALGIHLINEAELERMLAQAESPVGIQLSFLTFD